MYLIIEETQYKHTENNYHVEDCTDNYDKAVDMLQGYKLINKDKNTIYSIIKYESEFTIREVA
jgi:hypothetical protein